MALINTDLILKPIKTVHAILVIVQIECAFSEARASHGPGPSVTWSVGPSLGHSHFNKALF